MEQKNIQIIFSSTKFACVNMPSEMINDSTEKRKSFWSFTGEAKRAWSWLSLLSIIDFIMKKFLIFKRRLRYSIVRCVGKMRRRSRRLTWNHNAQKMNFLYRFIAYPKHSFLHVFNNQFDLDFFYQTNKNRF